jgi:peroxiredoxin
MRFEIAVGTDVGQRFPDFTFPALPDGRLTSLHEFRGKKLILLQFASW